MSSEWGSSRSKRPLAPPQAGAYFGNSMLLTSYLTQDLVNTLWHQWFIVSNQTQGVWLWPFTSRGVKSLREPHCLGVLYLSKLECLPRLYHPIYTPANLIGYYGKNLNYLLYILALVRTGTNIPKGRNFSNLIPTQQWTKMKEPLHVEDRMRKVLKKRWSVFITEWHDLRASFTYSPTCFCRDYVAQHPPMHHSLETGYDSDGNESQPRWNLGNLSCKSYRFPLTLPS